MTRTKTLAFIVVVLIATLLRFSIATNVYEYFVDDAYIFMRYAENFAFGNGLVYNVGEKVLGFTSVLYLILVSLLKALFLQLPTKVILSGLNLLLFSAYSFLLYRFLDSDSRLYWPTVIVLFFSYPSVDATVNGMETMLFIASLIAALWAVGKSYYILAVFLSSVNVLTRPEGVFLLLAVLFVSFSRLKFRTFLIGLLLSFTLVAVVLVSLYFYYGTFIPHSILAKSSQVTSMRWGGYQTSTFTRGLLLAFGFSDNSFAHLPSTVRLILSICFVVSFGVFLMGIVASAKKRLAVFIAGVFYISVVGFYEVGNPIRTFSWYTYPTSICYFIVTLYGVEHMLLSPRSARVIRIVQTGILLLCILSTTLISITRSREVNKVRDLHSLAVSIQENFPKTQSIMLGDIGVVGYLTKVRIIDLAGLVSPIVLQTLEDGSEPTLGEIVKKTEPDIICLQNNPLKGEVVNESHLLYRTFRNQADRDSFIENYLNVNLNAQTYAYMFIKKRKQ